MNNKNKSVNSIDLQKAIKQILSSEAKSGRVAEQLQAMGYAPTNEMVVAYAMFQQAAKGNVRAFEIIQETIRDDNQITLF